MFAHLNSTSSLQRVAAVSAVISGIAISLLRASGAINDRTVFVLLTIPLALATLSAVLSVTRGATGE